jgi:hypothetical protein
LNKWVKCVRTHGEVLRLVRVVLAAGIHEPPFLELPLQRHLRIGRVRGYRDLHGGRVRTRVKHEWTRATCTHSKIQQESHQARRGYGFGSQCALSEAAFEHQNVQYECKKASD